MIRVRVTGEKRLARTLRRLSAAIEREMATAVREAAQEVAREARAAIEEGGASAGDDRGLAASIRVEQVGLSASVGTDLDYGAHLEFGTQAMAPRPWLQPALERAKPKIKRRLERALGDAVRATTKGGSAT